MPATIDLALVSAPIPTWCPSPWELLPAGPPSLAASSPTVPLFGLCLIGGWATVTLESLPAGLQRLNVSKNLLADTRELRDLTQLQEVGCDPPPLEVSS